MNERFKTRGKPIQRIEHGKGITQEIYADGSMRFGCDTVANKKNIRPCQRNGGVIFIHADGGASVRPVLRQPSRQIALFLTVASGMGDKPLTLDDVENYKEESRIMLEALRSGNPGFFRSLANAISPTKAGSANAAQKRNTRQQKESETIEKLANAASALKGCPSTYLVFRTQGRAGVPVENDSKDLQDKLSRIGFAWIKDVPRKGFREIVICPDPDKRSKKNEVNGLARCAKQKNQNGPMKNSSRRISD